MSNYGSPGPKVTASSGSPGMSPGRVETPRAQPQVLGNEPYRVLKTFAAALAVLTAAVGCSPAPRYTVHPYGGQSSGPFEANTSSKSTDSVNVPLLSKPPKGTKFRGVASYYADKYHGQQTASGETFDMYGLTCAHNQLPFNTWLEVRNLSNDRTVIVRVNDRGPFVEGRIIDLSYGAAKELGMVEKGVQEVEITVIR